MSSLGCILDEHFAEPCMSWMQGIVFNRLPPSVRGSPAPSTIDTSASRARTIRTVINDQVRTMSVISYRGVKLHGLFAYRTGP
jgi:hypothetical protein